MSQGLSYRILEPVWLNEQGIRDYSEDYIYPDQKAGISDQVRQFLVCDGVGGSTRGDQASKFVCSMFPVKVNDKLEQAIDSDFIPQNQERLLNKALYEVEMDMDAFSEQHPAYRGMATTLTYLNLSKNGAVVAWAGDSRVYQIRNGQVKQRTSDHSLVNELIKRGEITEEQARTHPRKNVILRAISGSSSATKLDVDIWQDVQKGDVFFLCTDGILEAFESDHQLAELLSSGMTLDMIRDRIDALCKEHSRDNYSMYLIKVQDVEGQPLIPIQSKTKQVASAGSTTIIATEATKSATSPVEIEEEAFEDVRHEEGKHPSTVPPKPEKEGGIPKRY
ncbi:MAG: serine/threonine-protein phosphatase, partial [Phaeodactylibacter sp.]|nr:serine/threonine-protein phosphatase [Phaeodactylibacter sp.]